jgi:hypothetical protein
MAARFRSMVAKYPGTCRRCAGPITPGQTIRWAGRGASWHLAAECTGPNADAGDRTSQGATEDEPRGWTPGDTGTYYGPSSAPRASRRNARGRCEDAPCCGCCTT